MKRIKIPLSPSESAYKPLASSSHLRAAYLETLQAFPSLEQERKALLDYMRTKGYSTDDPQRLPSAETWRAMKRDTNMRSRLNRIQQLMLEAGMLEKSDNANSLNLFQPGEFDLAARQPVKILSASVPALHSRPVSSHNSVFGRIMAIWRNRQ